MKYLFWIFPFLVVPHLFLLSGMWQRLHEMEDVRNQISIVSLGLYKEQMHCQKEEQLWKCFGGKDVRKREEILEKNFPITFIETKIEKHPQFTEVSVQLKSPVALSGEQLQQLLSTIEDIHHPAICVVNELKIERMEDELGEHWLVDMKILKRELL